MSDKIRTIDQLEAYLTTDLKWRTQELFAFERMLKVARSHEAPSLLRGSLALIYAHWEGYIKNAGSAYLQYVSRKNLTLGEMRVELAGVALRSQIQRLAEEKSPQRHTEIIEVIEHSMGHKIHLPYETTTIRTNSNLNFKLFDSIMHSLGCDASRHKTRSQLIDERLLGRRNEIAHGRREYVSLDEWIEARETIEAILRDVRNQLANSAATNAYRRGP